MFIIIMFIALAAFPTVINACPQSGDSDTVVFCFESKKTHPPYQFKIPNGWQANRDVGHGMFAAFYSKDHSFNSAPAAVYVKTARRDASGNPTKKAFLDYTLDFLKQQVPNLKAKDLKEVELSSGKKAVVRQYLSEKYKMFDVGAYIEEKDHIAFLVLTARTEAELQKNMPMFREIVESYSILNK